MLSSLLNELEIDSSSRSKLAEDYERLANGLPHPLEEYVRDRYEINLSSEYGGLPITIQRVANYGVAEVLGMYPYLMGATGMYLKL